MGKLRGLTRHSNSTSEVTVHINRMTGLSYFLWRSMRITLVHLNPQGFRRLKSTMGSTRKLIGRVRCLRVKESTLVVSYWSRIGKVPGQKFVTLCVGLKRDNGNGMTKNGWAPEYTTLEDVT